MRRKQNFIPSTKNVSLDILALPDCIHLLENGRCSELNIKKCKGSYCSFCIASEKSGSLAEKWSERLSSLSEQRQTEIARKYYGGKMPWKEQGRENKNNV